MSYTREHFDRVRDSEHCGRCNYDRHQCPGCGTALPHDVGVCAECQEENR